MIKVIIFDSDGMITSSRKFTEDLEQDYGIPIERTLSFFKTVFNKCLIGEADLKEELKDYVDQWGWKKSVESLTDYWFEHGRKVDERFVKKIYELRARGIKCYLCTNQEQYRTNYMRKEMGFGELFDALWSSAEIGYKKPEKEFFQIVYDNINDGTLRKDEVMFWDDDKGNVQGAEQFGFQAYFYDGNFENFEKNVQNVLQ